MIVWVLVIAGGGDALRAADGPARPVEKKAGLIPTLPRAGISQFAWFTPKKHPSAPSFQRVSFEATAGGVRMTFVSGTNKGSLTFKSMVLPIDGVCIASEGSQLLIKGPNVNARCNRMTLIECSQRACLEGAVSLKFPEGDTVGADLLPERVVVDLETGYLELADSPLQDYSPGLEDVEGSFTGLVW
jgi:hypothetical protein